MKDADIIRMEEFARRGQAAQKEVNRIMNQHPSAGEHQKKDPRITLQIDRIPSLLRLFTGPKTEGAWHIQGFQSRPITNGAGVVLAEWNEPHANGFTSRELRVNTKDIPELVEILLHYYNVQQRSEEE